MAANTSVSIRSRWGRRATRPRGVAYRRQVAHFGNGEQPFVFGIVPGDSPEKIDILDRWQPLDVEVLQTPELQALAHHGMHAAVKPFLPIAILRQAEGVILGLTRLSSTSRDPPIQ